jgi:hypothetical protein
MFYPSLKTAQRRLKILADSHEIGRGRDNINAEFIYFLTKPKQLRHSVLLTDFLREFSRIATIESCKPEVVIGNVRADALIGYKRKGVRRLAFVEVQIAQRQAVPASRLGDYVAGDIDDPGMVGPDRRHDGVLVLPGIGLQGQAALVG